MEIVKIETNKLISPEWNPREITEEELTKLKTSLKEFGYIEPIIVNSVNNHVVGGNQRLRALESLGYNEVDCVYVTIEDINREKACNVALNKISGDWDTDKLQVVLEEIELSPIDISLTGFDEIELEELNPIIEDTVTDMEAVEEDEYVEEEDIEVHVAQGDLFRLGNHYLLCGDSTLEADVEKLVSASGEKKSMDMVFTDPPYGMKKEKDGIANDNLNYDDLLLFNKQWIPLSFKALKYNGSWYCWGTDEPLMDIYSNILKPMIKQNEITFRNLITWNKGAFGSGGGTGVGQAIQRSYFPADEKCLFVMTGVQGFNNNSDNYFEKWEPIRSYLEKEAKKVGLNNKQLKEITGVGMYGHWFTKSQWTLIPKEHYIKLQNYYSDAFKKEYDEIKKEYDEIKKEWYSTRAYFNNTHDMMTNIWEFQRVRGNERKECGGHPTPKPIQLCSRAILSSSRENENILDVFGGSGSTLIACEQTNRNCYMMELDPYYCQVIINRWETYTGKKATKIKGDIKCL